MARHRRRQNGTNNLRLSTRALAKMESHDYCAGCAYLQMHYPLRKYPFPVPFPGVSSSLDSAEKKWVRSYFAENGLLPPGLPDIAGAHSLLRASSLHFSKFRHRDRASGITLTGSPDEIVIVADGSYHVIDYKTSKLTPFQELLIPYYAAQLNSYAFLASEHPELDGFECAGLHLVYFQLRTDHVGLASDRGPQINFDIESRQVSLRDLAYVPSLLVRARRLYDTDTAPPHNVDCENLQRLETLSHMVSVTLAKEAEVVR